MDQPLVSVITLTFNHEKYISGCIESVLNQTFTDWEMIILDDGSTDKTYEVISRYKDPRIKAFTQINGGPYKLGENYNLALSKCRGEFIAILEGDDFWDSRKLEIQVPVLQNDKSILLSWGRVNCVHFETGRFLGVLPPFADKYSVFWDNVPTGCVINAKTFPKAMTWIVRKEVLTEIGGFRFVLPLPSVDTPTMLEISKLGKFKFHWEIMGTSQMHRDQITRNYSLQLLEGGRKVVLNHFDSLPPEIRKNVTISRKDILRLWEGIRVIAFSRSGRIKLVKKDFKGARNDYLKSLTTRGLSKPVWRLRSLTGLLFSFFGIDLEGFVRLLGKKTYK